jgi:3'-phosphoadenosine 5'-phosphosulfate sulfotransferase (PAPS reductase)/FAD synthetase
MDLSSYDIVLINSSAGKDSQAMLTYLVELADEQQVPRDRLVVVHADLGRVEWEGTRDLAHTQAKLYGLRFIAVKRPQNDLLDHIEARGMWPSSAARYCTSDHKRGPVRTVMTALVKEAGLDRPVRILNCMGIRAQESPARAKKHPFEHEKTASNGRRHVDLWFPIFDWSVEQVWATIRRSGVPHHFAYDAGMPRLSCVFCVLAGNRELILAARLNPDLAAEYLAAEQRMGHTFKAKTSFADLMAAADSATDEELEAIRQSAPQIINCY